MFGSEDPASRVTVVDIEMPFGSMVAFMVKWTIASIPAIIILFLIGAMIAVFLGGALASLGVIPS